jgi:hypothetical protein
MTIAIGFKCVDGIVLAADSLYTQGIAKLYGQKIFPIPSNGYYALTIAGAGGIPTLKGAVREIKKALHKTIRTRQTTLAEVQLVIEDSLSAYFPKHIESAPRDQQGDLAIELIIAVWIAGSGTHLLETARATATEVDSRCSVGTGQWLTECLGDMFIPPGERPTVEMMKPLAAYIVGRATKYIQYCGGETFVRALLDDGTDDRAWREEIREADSYFVEFFRTVGSVREMLGASPRPEEIPMNPFADVLKTQVVEFRRKREAHRERRAQIRKRAASSCGKH